MSKNNEEVRLSKPVMGALRLYAEVTKALNEYSAETGPINAAEFSILIKLMVDGFCSTASGGPFAKAIMIQAIKDLLDSPPFPGLEPKPEKKFN